MSRVLTPKTTLEQLRKDAKRWLKALRASDPAARARLKAAWPKAPAEPALRDVQHALAREYGQDSWIALKAELAELALARRSLAEQAEVVLRHGWDGDAAAARRLLRRRPELARFNLFTAAACGDLDEIERRLARDPEAAQRTGGPRAWTALAHVTYGRLDEVNALTVAQRLLDAGADPNARFDDGWGSPFKILTGAIRLGEGARPSHPQAEALVELLIAAGADPYDLQALYNVSIVGEDLHWYEVLWRHCEAQGTLGKWRASAPGTLYGKSMLDYLLGNAIGQGHLARAEWLLERGADANTTHANTRQPLHAVAQFYRSPNMLALLERHGAQPVRLEGAEAFIAACARQDDETVRALLAAQPERARDPASLQAAASHGAAEIVALLLSQGADVQGLDHDGISALHRAVQSGSLETVKRLLEAGADPDLRERRWHGTPLSWSVVLNKPEITDYMAPIGHDVRPLVVQGRLERLEAVLQLLPWRANEQLPGDAPTPLFCLPEDEETAIEAARLLIAHGADPSIRNASGQSPAEFHRARGLEDVAEAIEAGHAS